MIWWKSYRARHAAATLVVVLAAVLPARAQTALLRADFENQTVGQPVGLRGAAFGEPDWFGGPGVNVIRAGITGSLSLEMADIDTLPFPALLRFDLPDSGLADRPDLTVSVLAVPVEVDDYALLVTDAGAGGSATFQFCKVQFDNGTLTVTDQAHPDPQPVGSFTADNAVRLELRLHQAAGTWDLLLDGAVVLADRAWGGGAPPVGSVWLTIEGDADILGVVDWDDLTVTRGGVAAVPLTWSEVKHRYR